MILPECHDLTLSADTLAAAHAACDTIAPAWPLDRAIAVSPYWPLRDRSIDAVRHEMALLTGGRLALPLSDYKRLWDEGRITPYALHAAAHEDHAFSVDDLLTALDRPERAYPPLPLLSDTLDLVRDQQHSFLWREQTLTQISQCCATYFDHWQSDWQPALRNSLYTEWRTMLAADRGAESLMRAPDLRRRARRLPHDPEALLHEAVTRLQLAPDQVLPFFRAALLRVQGWASLCAYWNWQADLAATPRPQHLLHLLAVRVAWEILLDDTSRAPDSAWSAWQIAWHTALNRPYNPDVRIAAVWQRAHELTYQQGLFATLRQRPTPTPAQPELQAVFCIDVRSEPLRRHLERTTPSAQTLGFAGFFGVPMQLRTLGSCTTTPQLPGLLAPACTATETTGDPTADAHILHSLRAHDDAARIATQWSRMPASAFTLVESLGPGKLLPLLRKTFRLGDAPTPSTQHTTLRPALIATTAEKAAIARRFLEATGLHLDPAYIIALVGHGSQTVNNPLATALDCGACCGQNGFTNAQVLSAILNDPAVRAALAQDGLPLPSTTHVIAASHNTTTDEVSFDAADLARLSPTQQHSLRSAFATASELARTERSTPDLPVILNAAQRSRRTAATATQRATDWAETRPEWGLANNAAFIIAPRRLTRGLDLAGRTFLHEYDPALDPSGSLLEQILTAPMLVTHWINMQYLASTTDPLRFGAGNKTLHNVVGGNLGVFEGNGGDLRIGLALQSVHDGRAWRHDPLRLSVLIAAPRSAIDAVIAKHETVRHLVEGRWLELLRLDTGHATPHPLERRPLTGWHPITRPSA